MAAGLARSRGTGRAVRSAQADARQPGMGRSDLGISAGFPERQARDPHRSPPGETVWFAEGAGLFPEVCIKFPRGRDDTPFVGSKCSRPASPKLISRTEWRHGSR